MKIRFQREPLLAAFQTAAAVAPQRSPKPILSKVKLAAKDGQLVLTATDLEVGVRVRLSEGVEIEQDGEVMLGVDRFGSLLRESSDEEMSLTGGPDGNELVGPRSRFKLTSEDPSEFPDVAEFDATAYHQLPGRLFKEMIKRTLFATDTESGRFALGGVLFEFGADEIIAVSTDGRRLAKMSGPATQHGGHDGGDRMTIVPSRSLGLIERSLTDLDADVQIATRNNDVLVKSPQTTYFSRLVEGRFPTWREVLPEEPVGEKVELAVGGAYACLRQAAVLADKETRGVDFAFTEGSLVLAAASAEFGEARVEMPVNYSGPEITVRLDSRFVSDLFRALPPDAVVAAHVSSNQAAARFSLEGYDYVLMPMADD